MRCTRAARSRRTRSWVAWTAVGVILAACGSRPAPSASRPAAPTPTPVTAREPAVNPRAFAGHGELAFISRGALWLLDGDAVAPQLVAAPRISPASPAFSPDGRWLAFTASSHPAGASAVWLAAGDGSGAHQVVARAELIGWSPVSDVLAVQAGNAIQLVQPDGSARALTRSAGFWGAVWSPDGRYLAVATRIWPSATTLAAYPVVGGRPTTWLRLNARRGVLNGMNEIIAAPAAWWPRWGIGFWVFGDGMVHNNDQTPVDVIPAPGARPRLLGYTLSDQTTTAVAASNGSLAIVNNPDLRAVGRIIWEDKRVEACSPATGTCTPVPAPPSAVTLDPAWSPDGSHLAYVRAPYRASPAFPQNVTAAWYDAHQLWLYDPATRAVRQLHAAGASVPAWSADGKSLLYVARDAIWLLPRLDGPPVRIAGPLFPPGHWPLSYYGQLGWASKFAWWAGNMAVPPTRSPALPTPASTTSAALLADNGIATARFGRPVSQVPARLDAIFGPSTRPYRATNNCGIDH